MNERIQELSEQARQYAESKMHLTGVKDSAAYDKKFAELIVRECMSVCIDDIADPRDTAELKCAKKIKQHFGVE